MILLRVPAFGQWSGQMSGVNALLKDVFFLNHLDGWAVGHQGTIIATMNGGQSWRIISNAVDSIEYERVQFVSKEVGFVSGNKVIKDSTFERREYLLIRTTNEGLTWERCDSTFYPDFRFRDLQFISLDEGFLAINNLGQNSFQKRRGILAKTTNAGLSWQVIQQKSPDLIGALSFCQGSTGYGFWGPLFHNNDSMLVETTFDGGNSWQATGSISGELIKRALCVTPSHLWAIGLGALRSTDAGKTWDSWNWFSPVDEGEKRFVPTDIEVFSPNTAILAGNYFTSATDGEGLLMTTRDGGDHWTKEFRLDSSSFCGLSLVNGAAGWLVGGDGLVLHSGDVHTTISVSESTGRNKNTLQSFPNPWSRETSSRVTIHFIVEEADYLSIALYDMLGRRIRELKSGFYFDGNHNIVWDGNTEDGIPVSAGIYVLVMKTSSFVVGKKLLMIR